MLYGCEIGSILKTERSRIEAFETWFYRNILKIIQSDKINK